MFVYSGIECVCARDVRLRMYVPVQVRCTCWGFVCVCRSCVCTCFEDREGVCLVSRGGCGNAAVLPIHPFINTVDGQCLWSAVSGNTAAVPVYPFMITVDG